MDCNYPIEPWIVLQEGIWSGIDGDTTQEQHDVLLGWPKEPSPVAQGDSITQPHTCWVEVDQCEG